MNDNQRTLLLWMDVETTGLKPSFNRLLEIGLQWTDTTLRPLDDGFHTPIRYTGPISNRIRRMHGPNGLLDACASPTAPILGDAQTMAADYINRHPDARILPAGASLRFDRNWLDHWMPGLLDPCDHRSLDVSGLLEAFRMWTSLDPNREPTDHRVATCLQVEINAARRYRQWMQTITA